MTNHTLHQAGELRPRPISSYVRCRGNEWIVFRAVASKCRDVVAGNIMFPVAVVSDDVNVVLMNWWPT